ncbi:MAG TPA: flavodoxin family protein [Candidatus Cryptobacteroides merdipullorum]|uniref:Flavodoxin family protein n=1 Tax=Candidatus Cryptobacteroides merdipullorum TaxID=2840771 RepID=A0A9D1GPY1_9BACT|nr:flavodoxin family protein [Candidatus Cryptobacteroides merdipullorum]
MKVLLINGSPHKEGNTFIALSEIAGTLRELGDEAEIVWIGNRPVRGCIACGSCHKTGHCAFQDGVMPGILAKAAEADGIVVGSPVYYAGPNGALCAVLDRMFYSGGRFLQRKPAAAVVVCRRGGASAAFDRLNKYFTMSNMPVVPSQYWNSVHGHKPGEAAQDAEGLQTMRTLARNMHWMLHGLDAGRADSVNPEPRERTNFIR